MHSLQKLTRRDVSNSYNKSFTGFTIIEVLIVLAIAALILLVVFLAVPALQRSQRNNGRKSDAARISTSVGKFVSNNYGILPASVVDLTTIANKVGILSQYGDGSVSAPTGIFTNTSIAAPKPTAKNIATGFYLTNSVGKAYAGAQTTKSNVVILDRSYQCDPTKSGGVISASSNQIALLYSLENSSSKWTWSCISAL